MPSRLEVIVGPMFSGKTERLIAKLYRAQYAKKRIRILKPKQDTRTESFADSVEKLSVVCMLCGADDARLSQRLSRNAEQVAIGDAETHQVRCRVATRLLPDLRFSPRSGCP